MLLRFSAVKSTSLIGFSCRVLRPTSAKAPKPAVRYCAFGFAATYPTTLSMVSTPAGQPEPAPSTVGFPVQNRFAFVQSAVGTTLLHSGLTPEPVPFTPLAFRIVRSPAESPFRFE